MDQLQRGRPAFRPGGHVGQDIGLECPAVRLAEESRGLVGIEPEVVAGQFGDLADRPELCDRDARRSTTREDHRETFGRPIDQFADDELDVRRVVDQVEVVEDQDGTMRRDGLQLPHEDIDDGVPGRAAQAFVVEHGGRVRGERRVRLATGGDEVVQDRDPVAVVLVEPVPQGPQPGPAREVRQERRLAVARVGEDQDDPVVDLGGQPVQQAVPGQRFLAKGWWLDLRVLDRKAAHVVTVGSGGRCGGGRSRSGSDRVR